MTSRKQVKALMEGLLSHFHFLGLRVEYDYTTSELSYEMASMGRSLYPDESSVAHPYKLGHGVTIDELRGNEISAFVNGFYAAVRK